MTANMQERTTKPASSKVSSEATPAHESAEASQTAPVRHVIVALSGEAEADRLVQDVAQMVAELTPAHLHYVSVVPPLPDPAAFVGFPPGAPAVVPAQLDPDHLDATIETRRNLLAEIAGSAGPVAHDIMVRTGIVDAEILAAADEVGASLIVVGSGERSWLEGLFSTDVAQQVITKAMCPVLVMPERAKL